MRSASPGPGLCASCRHGRAVPGRATTFWFCERSRSDRAYPRYPRLPVLACRGHEPQGAERDARA